MLSKKELNSLRLRKLFDDNGFSFFRMAKFEEYDFYADKKDFLPSNSILTFTDADGRLMALRPDVTLSLLKSSGNGKFYYSENVYRVPHNSASFREFSQAGIEIVGDISTDNIQQVLSLALQSLQLTADNRNFMLVVADANMIIQCLNGITNERFLKLLGQKNIHGLKELNAPNDLISLAELFMDTQHYSTLHSGILADICRGLPADHSRVDFSAVSNIKYYNGIVFKGFINGIPQAVLSGGQYRIMGRNGIGFAVYLDLTGDTIS